MINDTTKTGYFSKQNRILQGIAIRFAVKICYKFNENKRGEK